MAEEGGEKGTRKRKQDTISRASETGTAEESLGEPRRARRLEAKDRGEEEGGGGWEEDLKARTDGILGRDGGDDEAKETAREMETEKENASLREREEFPMVNFRSRSRRGAEQHQSRAEEGQAVALGHNRVGVEPGHRKEEVIIKIITYYIIHDFFFTFKK